MKIDHFSINVSDHQRSARFYCDGLGFEHVEDRTFGNEAAGTALIQGDYRVHSRTLRGGGITLILNRTEIPMGPLPEYRRQYGLTNFAVQVDDLEASLERLRDLGGTPVDSSRAQFSVGSREVQVIICLDPDGQPVELIANTEQASMTQQAIAAADAHMDAVNTADSDKIRATQNFPFVHLWPDGRCEIAMQPEEVPEVDRVVLGDEWDHTELDSTDVITAGPDAVVLHVTFTRRRKDGSSLGSYEAIWVATRIDGHWGIQFRNGTLSLDRS